MPVIWIILFGIVRWDTLFTNKRLSLKQLKKIGAPNQPEKLRVSSL